VPVCVAPALLCASFHVADVPGHHMLRSTTTGGPAELITVDTAVSASRESSSSTQML